MRKDVTGDMKKDERERMKDSKSQPVQCDLASKECIPCKGGVPPLAGDELQSLSSELGNDWQLVKDHHLVKYYKFPDFAKALAFTNRIGALAEEQGHHPDIELRWGDVVLTLWTHKLYGLTESDFVFAAKADSVL